MEDQNPYTILKGYTLYDAFDTAVGEVEDTVYDAPSDVLKYIVVSGHPIPAEAIEVDAEGRCITVPFGREVIESSPRLHRLSGEFDAVLHDHYKRRG